MCLEYDEKLNVCVKQMAEEFGITEKQAETIISWLDLEDQVIDRYADAINEASETKMNNWEKERKLNPDIM